MVRVGVVEVVEVPAAVDGQSADGVGALGDQAPQVVGGGDAAGVAAAHADDDDRVVGGGAGGRAGVGRGGLGRGVGEFPQQVTGEGGDGRIVEGDGRGGAQTRGRGQPVAQFDGGQRVEAQLLEGPFRVDVVCGRVPEDGGRLGADQVDDGLGAGLFVEPGQALGQAEGRLGAGAHGAAGPGADQAAQQGRHLAVTAQDGEVQTGGGDGGAGHGEGGVEEGEALLGGERGRAGAGHALQVLLGQLPRHAAGGRPGTPGQGEPGQARVPAQAGHGVQEGVARRVVGLGGGAGGAGEGGEHHERGEVQVARGLVQMPHGVRLGAQDGGQALLGEGLHEAVVEGARGVHDAGDGVVGGHGGEQPPHLFRVAHVAGHDGRLGPGLPEFGAEFGGAGGVGTAASGEQQVPYAVFGDQVAGEYGAQTAGAAGDDDGALGVPGCGGVTVAGADTGEARAEHRAVAEGGLRFVGGQGGGESGGRVAHGGGGIEVEQAEAAGVFGLGGAHQAPDGSGGGVGDAVAARGDRAPGDEHQAGAARGVRGEPFLEPGEDACGERVHRGRDVVAGARDAGEHQLGRAGAEGGGVPGEGVDRRPGGRQRVAQVVRVGAEQADGTGEGFPRGAGQPYPVQGEQGVAFQGGGGGSPGVGGGAQHQGADRGDGRAGGVGQGHGDGVVTGRGDADPGLGGAARVQGHVLPGEGQPAAGVLAQRRERGGVQGGVEQRGVEAEGGGVAGRSGVEGDLGEGLLAAPPDGAQAAERGAVGEPGVGQTVVEAVERDGLGTGGRPDGGVELLRLRRGVGAGARVPSACCVQGRSSLAVGAGVQAQGAAAGLVGAADPHLELDPAVLGQGERRGQREVLDPLAADLVAGAHGQFQERGAGQQHGAAHGVVGEPRVGARRQTAGEEQAVGVGEGDGGGEQRVVGGAESRGPQVAGESGDSLGPEAAVLEGVGGQVGAGGAGPLEPALPAHGGAPQVQTGDGLGERGSLGAVLAQRRQHDGPVVSLVVQDGAGEGGERGVGAEFEEQAGAVAGEPGDTVGEAHRLPDVVGPVVDGGQLLQGGGRAGQVGDDRDGGGLRGESGDDRPELLQHGLHERRVEGVRDPQPAGAASQGGDA